MYSWTIQIIQNFIVPCPTIQNYDQVIKRLFTYYVSQIVLFFRHIQNLSNHEEFYKCLSIKIKI